MRFSVSSARVGCGGRFGNLRRLVNSPAPDTPALDRMVRPAAPRGACRIGRPRRAEADGGDVLREAGRAGPVRRAGYCAVQPPSTRRLVPVTIPEAGEAR